MPAFGLVVVKQFPYFLSASGAGPGGGERAPFIENNKHIIEVDAEIICLYEHALPIRKRTEI